MMVSCSIAGEIENGCKEAEITQIETHAIYKACYN